MKDMINHTIELEGGFVNHPADKGGATKYGITQGTLSNWLNRPVTVDDVKNITKEDAFKIYESLYLKQPKINLIPDEKLQALVFDMAVHSGVNRAIKTLQKCVGTKQDGVLGAITLGTISSFKDPKEVRERFLEARKEFLERLVERNPTQIVFAKGWSNRIEELKNKYV